MIVSIIIAVIAIIAILSQRSYYKEKARRTLEKRIEDLESLPCAKAASCSEYDPSRKLTDIVKG